MRQTPSFPRAAAYEYRAKCSECAAFSISRRAAWDCAECGAPNRVTRVPADVEIAHKANGKYACPRHKAFGTVYTPIILPASGDTGGLFPDAGASCVRCGAVLMEPIPGAED